jgi:drug/metabolite transporter (DMT)-like permease
VGKNVANLAGIAALLGWSMNVAITRQLAEADMFGLPSLSLLVSGTFLVSLDAACGRGNPATAGADPKFWLLGGASFVLYLVCYICGLAGAASREVSLALGLANYLWPAFILLLMPLFFPCRLRATFLLPGILLCLVGVTVAFLRDLGMGTLWREWGENGLSLIAMLAAAFLWAFYSNAARKWGGQANGVGWFQLAAGLVFLALWAAGEGELGLSGSTLLPFLLHAIVVNALSYLLWDIGIRRGDLDLLGILANFLPVGSVLFGFWHFGGDPGNGLWSACLMISLGAVFCRRGLSAA